jgi:hypothetical protein
MDSESGRRDLVVSMANAVVRIAQMAEAGASVEGIDAEMRALKATYLAQPATEDTTQNPAELVGILRRILRKEARAYWTIGSEQQRLGERDAALQRRRVSVILDEAADALDGPFQTSIPSRTDLAQVPASAPKARRRAVRTDYVRAPAQEAEFFPASKPDAEIEDVAKYVGVTDEA